MQRGLLCRMVNFQIVANPNPLTLYSGWRVQEHSKRSPALVTTRPRRAYYPTLTSLMYSLGCVVIYVYVNYTLAGIHPREIAGQLF